jgi:hypothetical protein
MKVLNQNEYIETGKYEVIAERSQGSCQSKNYVIRLYDTVREKDRYVLEVIERNKYQYSYDDEDVSNPQAAVDEAVNIWINDNIDSPVDKLIEKYNWGLIDHFDEVSEDYAGECIIIWIGNSCGYTPVGYIEDNDGDPRIFGSVRAAQKYIAKNLIGGEIYRLSHNESRHPSYCIVANTRG